MSYHMKPLRVLQYAFDKADMTAESLFWPALKVGSYNLLYATQNYYVLLRQIYTIYERILKAQQIISDKVNQDLLDSASNQANL
jgi:hypothetical protein